MGTMISSSLNNTNLYHKIILGLEVFITLLIGADVVLKMLILKKYYFYEVINLIDLVIFIGLFVMIIVTVFKIHGSIPLLESDVLDILLIIIRCVLQLIRIVI